MSFIVKKSLHIFNRISLPALILVMATASSCNKKEESTVDEPAVTISTVAVKNFNLKADSKVLSSLDSVFFSIDLNKKVIFNADSLPLGTKVSRLIPVITFQTSVSEARLVSRGKEKNDTVDYLTNPNDSIDFTNDVTLNVTAADGKNKYSYTIKVNVHTQKPDSMMWDKMAVAKLPSLGGSPAVQKSVRKDGKVFTLLREGDGSYTLASAEDLFAGIWTREKISLPFEADVRSLEANDRLLWILDTQGRLYSSPDGKTWSDTGEKWVSIIGPYLDSMLGIKDTPTGLTHCHYPASDKITDTPVDPEFPLSGRSATSQFSTKWAELPTIVFAGGVKPSGDYSGSTWAFDGQRWTTINEVELPALKGAVMIRYVEYRNTGGIFQGVPYEVLAVIGGRLADGSFNRSIYLSPDNGVNWRKGSVLTDLPEYFPSLSGADGIVMSTPLSADLAKAWTPAPSPAPGRWLKPAYTLDGFDITWECPYIYIIGGETGAGSLSDTIWRGVLARLAFTPII